MSLEAKQAKKKALSIQDKCEYVAKLADKNGFLKYRYVGGNVVGAKGDPIKSTIVFKDADGNKQTLSVDAYKSHHKWVETENQFGNK